MTKKVGIFSGTFDPIHVGHVEVCLVAKAACELDDVVVFVERNPKHKEEVLPYEDRLAMTKLALKDFQTIKVGQSSQSTTYQTTKKYLDKHYDKYKTFLIIGSDMVRYLENWEEASAIFKQMKLCVFLRDLKEEKFIKSQLKNLADKYKATYTLLPPVWSPVSSSSVKSDLMRTGKSDLVHKDVLHYIKDKKLYDSSSGTSK